MSLAEKSKIRMNLAAIKKVDPYAKNIVDTSSHVAFYTFNSDQNEWEKTDVEGAFFIYSRNAKPFHSIFINNRLNTTSFVEPITSQLELQSQPPFLLYRNERSRIRGFWFYNSQECDRIGTLVGELVQKIGMKTTLAETMENSRPQQTDVNIFKMLSKAQQEYNNSQQNIAPCNVLEFFASAKPTISEIPFFQRALPNTLSVEQLEKQQRAKTPRQENLVANQKQIIPFQRRIIQNNALLGDVSTFFPAIANSTELEAAQLHKLLDSTKLSPAKSAAITIRQEKNTLPVKDTSASKPALMPPTMFDQPLCTSNSFTPMQQPLNQAQLVQAFSYLIENDEAFIQKLHEAYLKTFTKSLMDTHISN